MIMIQMLKAQAHSRSCQTAKSHQNCWLQVNITLLVIWYETLYGFLLYTQSDYFRKISMKMLSLETRNQHSPRNAQVIPNQNNPGQGTICSKLSVAHFTIFAYIIFFAAS